MGQYYFGVRGITERPNDNIPLKVQEVKITQRTNDYSLKHISI